MVILLHGCAAMLFLRAWIPSLNFELQHGMGIGVYLLEFYGVVTWNDLHGLVNSMFPLFFGLEFSN